jgi:putative transposase
VITVNLFIGDYLRSNSSSRYRRKYSNSLWHLDWHEIRDLRWRGKWLIAYEDDASCFITDFGIDDNPSSDYAAFILERAISIYGKPATLLTSRNSVLFKVECDRRVKGITEFEDCLLKYKMKLLVRETSHSQANGKIGKFFSKFESCIKYFESISDLMNWYNNIRPHGSLGLNTPVKVYHKNTPILDEISYSSNVENCEMP